MAEFEIIGEKMNINSKEWLIDRELDKMLGYNIILNLTKVEFETLKNLDDKDIQNTLSINKIELIREYNIVKLRDNYIYYSLKNDIINMIKILEQLLVFYPKNRYPNENNYLITKLNNYKSNISKHGRFILIKDIYDSI